MEVSDDKYCIVCGKHNPIGFKADIVVDEETHTASCTLVIPAEFQGWRQMTHGGIISTLLDEVSAYAGISAAGMVVTGELKTRFKKPVPIEQEVSVSARVVNHVRRTVLVEAELSMQGEVLATSEAKMIVVRG